jgi:hypothetical protein
MSALPLPVTVIALSFGHHCLGLAALVSREGFTDTNLVIGELALRVPARIALIALLRLNYFSR